MTKRQIKKLSDSIREAIEASGQSKSAIGRALGISPAMMSRFFNAKSGLSVDRLDALAEHFDLEVVKRSKGK
jgi:transcriptional regulator with XRE-family HTH domain